MQPVSSDLLPSLLAPDTNRIKAAEANLNSLLVENPTALWVYFVESLANPAQGVAEMAALMLQKKFFKEAAMNSFLTHERMDEFIRATTSCVNETRTWTYLKRLAEVIVSALQILDKKATNELAIIQPHLDSTQKNIKAFVLYFIELLCEWQWEEEFIKSNSTSIVTILEKYLKDEDIETRTRGVHTVIMFLSHINDEAFLSGFSGLFSVVFSTLSDSIKSNSDCSHSCLKSLEDLCETHPKFVRSQIDSIISVFSEIANSHGLPSSLRVSAINAICTLATSSAPAVRQSPMFRTHILPALTQCIASAKDVRMDEWLEETEEESAASKNDLEVVASEAVGRLNGALTPKFFAKEMIPCIEQLLQQPVVAIQQQGLVALGYLMEGSKKVLIDKMPSILNIVIGALSNADPRIVYAALMTIGLISTEFEPEIQIAQNEIIMKALLELIPKCSSQPKMITRVCSALVSFLRPVYNLEDDEKTFLEAYVDSLVQTTVSLLDAGVKKSYYPLVEETLSLLSIICGSASDKFAPYYSNVMPLLVSLFKNIPNTTSQNNQIRVLVITTMGHAFASHTKHIEAIQGDIEQVFMSLLELLQSIEADDPQAASIWKVFAEICRLNPDYFGSFLKVLMPHIAKVLSMETSLSQTTDSVKAENPLAVIVNKKIELLGETNIHLNVSLYEHKKAGINALLKIAACMKSSFYPFINDLLPVIIPLTSIKGMREAREAAIRSMYHLCNAAPHDSEKAQIVSAFLPNIIEVINAFSGLGITENISFALKRVKKTLKLLKSAAVPETLMKELLNSIVLALKTMENEKKDLRGQMAESGQDEEAVEELNELYEESNRIADHVMEITAVILKLYKGLEAEVINCVSPFYMNMLTMDKPLESDLVFAIFFFDDVIKNLSMSSLAQGWKVLFSQYAAKWANESVGIRQNIMYGFGLMARRLPSSEFADSKGLVIEAVKQTLAHPNAFDEERSSLSECAIGTLGSLALFQSVLPQDEALLNEFLQRLPLKVNEDEMKETHGMLIQQVGLGSNPIVAAAIEKIRPVLVAIKADALAHPEHLEESDRVLLERL